MDIVITATLRPEILDLTLASFQKRFLREIPQTRLIINIDPIGDATSCAADVLAVCQRYFNRINHRIPEHASFSAAVKWGWEQVESDFFLHLEDDWLLTKQVDTHSIFRTLESDPNLASIRLNLTKNPMDSLVSNGLSLNPSVFRRAFVQEALPYFDLTLDPEKQFRHMHGDKLSALEHWTYRLYGSPGESAYVIDIGKKWRRFNQFDKWNDSCDGGVAWKERKNERAVVKIWRMIKFRAFLRYWRFIA